MKDTINEFLNKADEGKLKLIYYFIKGLMGEC